MSFDSHRDLDMSRLSDLQDAVTCGDGNGGEARAGAVLNRTPFPVNRRSAGPVAEGRR
jgi:hypothetical protein